MVICAMIGCSNRSSRDKVYFSAFQLLFKEGQGEQTHSIMEAQQCAWLKAISRDNLTTDKLANVFVYEEHFITCIC